MNKTPSISVIVTAYNVAQYIGRCLQSILEQDLSDFELIIINDGSTDDTQHIIQKHAGTDSRVKIIAQENSGVSSARNRGIRLAQGDYILHIDGDDWLDKNALKKLQEIAIKFKPDIIVTDFYMNYPDGKEFYISQTICTSTEQRFRDVLSLQCDTLPPTRLYRRSLLIQHGIYYPEYIRSAEDFCVDLQAFFYAENVIKMDHAFYHYYQRNSSTSHSPEKYAYDIILSYHFAKSFLSKNNIASDDYAADIQYYEFAKAFTSLLSASGNEEWHRCEFDKIRNNIKHYKSNQRINTLIATMPIRKRILISAYSFSYLAGRFTKFIFNTTKNHKFRKSKNYPDQLPPSSSYRIMATDIENNT